jgi:triosephosphate isomerase
MKKRTIHKSESIGLTSSLLRGRELIRTRGEPGRRSLGVPNKERFEGLLTSGPQQVVIAYEPVWAIATGRTATAAQAQETHAFIRSAVASALGAATGKSIRVQYGGSVNPENARALMCQNDIDGALVGGASLDPRSFAQIVRSASKKMAEPIRFAESNPH